MEKKLNNAIDELILVIKNNNDYKECLKLKEKLGSNEEINKLITNIKKYQKEYVRTNDKDILEELNKNINELEEIPLYNIYMKHLEKVNEMIDIVKEELTKYFDNLVNKETTN